MDVLHEGVQKKDSYSHQGLGEILMNHCYYMLILKINVVKCVYPIFLTDFRASMIMFMSLCFYAIVEIVEGLNINMILMKLVNQLCNYVICNVLMML